MMRIRLGMVLRIIEIITFAKAVITVTASPITMAGLSCDVTARAEQIPSTCTRIGVVEVQRIGESRLIFF